MTAGRWVAVDADTGTTVIIGRPGRTAAQVRRSAIDDWGLTNCRTEWRPDAKDSSHV